MSTTTHVKYMYVKYVMYSLLGWIDRCTSMVKGMGLCLYIAHVYLYRMVPRLFLYVHEYECMIKQRNLKYMLWCQVYDMMKYECA